MADNFDVIAQLLACPCSEHGKLHRAGNEWTSECCGSKFREEAGVLVLLGSD